MKSRSHDALRLDVAAFAADAGALSGRWPGGDLSRLAETQTPPADTALDDVAWRVEGERRPVAVGEAELWLALRGETRVWLTCQRCLQPYAQAAAFDTRLRFVRGEAEAEALDAELEDDVLALSRWLDLRLLVEDELLLALPIVPRHEACPQPLVAPPSVAAGGDAAADGDAELPRNPFAVLKALKGGGASGPDGDGAGGASGV